MYEPIKTKKIEGYVLYNELTGFLEESGVILASRMHIDLEVVKVKVYKFDLFGDN